VDLSDGNRRSNRVSTDEVVRIAPIAADGQVSSTEFLVQLNDSSERGIGFTLREPLMFGQHFLVHPPAPSRACLLYRVACCQRLPQQTYKIGAEFLCVLTTDQQAQDDDAVRRIAKAIVA
jgi:hypothetical protein